MGNLFGLQKWQTPIGMIKLSNTVFVGSWRYVFPPIAALIVVGWGVLGQASQLTAAEQGVHECDRLASFGADMERVAPWVPLAALRKPEVLDACEKAIEQEPDNPRFQLQYGYALVYNGKSSAGQRHILRAAAMGYAAAEYLAGILIEDQKFEGHDLPEPMTMYKRAADHGNPYAMYRLAQAAASGRGRDREEALNWARKAAANGLPNGDYHVAFIILSFRPHEKETEWALALVEKEIEAGNLEAMYFEAVRTWSHGPFISVPKFGYVNKRAYQLMKTAAERGHAFAQAHLGMFK